MLLFLLFLLFLLSPLFCLFLRLFPLVLFANTF
jgi:hypothetical protein